MHTGLAVVLLICLAAGITRGDDKPSEHVRILVGDPVVVVQGPEGETRWGYWQFPRIERLADGRIRVNWQVAADSATAYGSGGRGTAVSADEGKTWTPVDGSDAEELAGGTLLPNGDRLALLSETSIPLDSLDLPEPIGEATYNYGNQTFKYYDPNTLPEEVRTGYPQTRMAKGETSWVREYPKVSIPGAIQGAREGVLVRPFFMGNLVLVPDGSLWTSCYWRREIEGRISKSIPTFVRSADNGRTWDFVSDIPYQPDKNADAKWESRDGFTEPEIAFMPDGSMLAIMRTTDGQGPGPSYIARSTDGGKTWSTPKVFDEIGVLPQLLVLKDGFALASYGRPGVFVRATADPQGLTWGERVKIPLKISEGKEWSGTCAYTGLLPLSGNSALLVYSDFQYPDKEGNPRKTILVRKLTLTRE